MVNNTHTFYRKQKQILKATNFHWFIIQIMIHAMKMVYFYHCDINAYEKRTHKKQQ